MRRHFACLGVVLLMPAFVAAQQPPGTPQDTTPRSATSQDTTSDTLQVQRSEGRLGRPSQRHAANNMGLTSDQVIQLQQAIKQNGCDPGPVDGAYGQQTRQGVKCIRRKVNITAPGLNPVLAALNLGFTVPGRGESRGNPQPVRQDTTTPPDTAMPPDTSTPADTSVPPDTTTRRDTSVVPDTAIMYRDTSMQRDTTMRPLRPDTNTTYPDTSMHRDSTRMHPDTSLVRPDTSMHSDTSKPRPDTSRTHRPS